MFAIAVVRNPFLLPRSLIVRKDWIFSLNESKTMNNGVNRNQHHTVFYSTDPHANPDFALEKKNVFDDEIEEKERTNALYKARIYRYFDTREEAEEWARIHRSKYPALYNTARLTEQPLPEQPNVNAIRENDSSENEIAEQLSFERIVLGEVDDSQGATNASMDDEIFVISSDEEGGDGAYGEDSATVNLPPNAAPPVKIEIKNEPIKLEESVRGPVRDANSDTPAIKYEPKKFDEIKRASIRDVLNRRAGQAACSITNASPASQAPPSHIQTPQPVSCKLEYDNLSGFIPFTIDEHGHRTYFYHLKTFDLKSYVLQSMISLGAESNDDATFVQLLLIAFVAKPTHVDPIAIKLVKEFFMMRVQGDESRLANFNVLTTIGIEEMRRVS